VDYISLATYNSHVLARDRYLKLYYYSYVRENSKKLRYGNCSPVNTEVTTTCEMNSVRMYCIEGNKIWLIRYEYDKVLIANYSYITSEISGLYSPPVFLYMVCKFESTSIIQHNYTIAMS